MLICMISPFGMLAHANNGQPTPAELPSQGQWSISFDLSCSVSSEGTVSLKEIFKSDPAFAGFEAGVEIGSGGQSIHFLLNGPQATLPPNAELAVISVMDPNCDGEARYLLSVDGGGIMIIIDEF